VGVSNILTNKTAAQEKEADFRWRIRKKPEEKDCGSQNKHKIHSEFKCKCNSQGSSRPSKTT